MPFRTNRLVRLLPHQDDINFVLEVLLPFGLSEFIIIPECMRTCENDVSFLIDLGKGVFLFDDYQVLIVFLMRKGRKVKIRLSPIGTVRDFGAGGFVS
mmetsp:Transcript_34248/g.134175  ORF Transcript_34248/g.134175 Transcript_34248/m.134175 type:complete len:98 (-) Transcript_34248:6737-7030(-)